MSTADLAAFVELGRSPISEAQPAGAAARYEPEFEELQEQIGRIGSIHGGTVDWERVVALATQILKTKSKDFLAASYLVCGLFERQSYAGLARGLATLSAMCETHWDAGFPKATPPLPRVNSLQYCFDKLQPQLDSSGGGPKQRPQASDAEWLTAARDCLQKLATDFAAKYQSGSPSPNVAPTLRAMQALCDRFAAPKPAEKPPVTASATSAPGASGDSAAVAAAGGDFATPSAAAQAGVKLAKFFFDQNPREPRSYALLRAVHFGGIVEPPKDRVIPPIPAPRRQQLEALAASPSLDAISQLEAQFAQTPLWLDLQRLTSAALRGMGPEYRAALTIVESFAASLHRAFPALVALSFRDGTPFADGATRAWLAQLDGASSAGGSGGGPSPEDPLSQSIATARSLLAASKSSEAIQELTRAAESAAGMRAYFRARLALAEVLCDAARPAVAVPLLDELETLAANHRLIEWEPDLALSLFRQLYQALQKARPKPTPEEQRRLSDLFGQLCRLDPGAAMQLDGPSPR